MKKWFITLITFLSVFTLAACTNSDNLSGKTFNVAYTPVLEEEVDNPDEYQPFMKLKFSADNVVSNTLGDEEGTYELLDDELVIRFQNGNENLEITFTIKESEKDFSEYSAEINDSEYKVGNPDDISKFELLHQKLQKLPIEFIEA